MTNDYRLGAMTLAATKLDEMAAFYTGVFGVSFHKEPIEDSHIYDGSFLGVNFCLVPAALSGVKAEEGRMHLDVFVGDIDAIIAAVEANGGRTNGRLAEDDEVRCIGVFDPDDNFIVIKQPKSAG